MQPRESLDVAQASLRAKFQPERRRRGHPPLEIDPVAVYLLARDGHSAPAIAQQLCCHPGTIRRRFQSLLQAAREYRIRWSWFGQDFTLEWLQREEWASSPPAPQPSGSIHRSNGRRTPKQCRPGRPKLAINKERVLELFLAGYAPKGIAREVNCSVRTLERRFPDLLAGRLDRRTFERLLFRMAIQDGNTAALLLLVRRLYRQDRRRAEREKKRKFRSACEGSYDPAGQK